jgi:hypothetical protein
MVRWYLDSRFFLFLNEAERGVVGLEKCCGKLKWVKLVH